MNSEWTKLKLKDICINVSKTEKNPLENGLERYIGLEHIDPEELKISRWGLIKDGISFTKKFEKGQILFGKRRSYQKKAAVAEFDGICSGDILVFEAIEEKIVPELLPYIIQNDKFFDYSVETSAGSLSPRTNWKYLSEYTVELPDKETQKYIVKVLKNIEKTLEIKENLLSKTLIYSDKLKERILINGINNNNLINSKIGNIPKNWTLKKLGEIGEFKTSSVDKKMKENEIKVKLVNYMDVYSNNIIDSSIELMSVTAKEAQINNNNLLKGDILFTPTSETPDDIGHSAIISQDMEDTLYSYHLVRYRLNEDIDYLFRRYCFGSRYILKQFYKRATGSTRFTLSINDFNNTLITYPKSKEEQRSIGKILKCVEGNIECIEKNIYDLKSLKKSMINHLLEK